MPENIENNRFSSLPTRSSYGIQLLSHLEQLDSTLHSLQSITMTIDVQLTLVKAKISLNRTATLTSSFPPYQSLSNSIYRISNTSNNLSQRVRYS